MPQKARERLHPSRRWAVRLEMSDEIHRRLRREAEAAGCSMAEYARRALKYYLFLGKF